MSFYDSLMWFSSELNSTMEPMPEDVEQDLGEDILYQKDASFSAQLDLGPPQPEAGDALTQPSSTMSTVAGTTGTTAASSQAVQFMTSRDSDSSGTTLSPCELDCAAGGQCTLEGGVNRCQCPLGRSGATCDTGESTNHRRLG